MTYGNKGYTILWSFEITEYLLLGIMPDHILIDTRNLLFVFGLFTMNPQSPCNLLSKVHWWEIHLSRFDSAIWHIDRCENFFTDVLTDMGRRPKKDGNGDGKIVPLYLDIVLNSKELAFMKTDGTRCVQWKHRTSRIVKEILRVCQWREAQNMYPVKDNKWS